jgi:hypothetical protein
MDASIFKLIYAGEAGYRYPLGISELDVWYKNRRYIYQRGHARPRVAWREAVAKMILGPGGKASDLAGADPSYQIGELKRQGSQVITRRQPDGDPVHAAGGLVLVDVLRPGDPRLNDPAWRPPRGCMAAIDKCGSGAVWVYRTAGSRTETKTRLIRAFAYTAGPRVKVTGLWPVYQVHARQWTPAELAKRIGERVRRTCRERNSSEHNKAKAAELAKVQAERERVKGARARVKAAAAKVDQLTIRLVDAETSLARWPGGERQAKVDRYRVELARAWAEWLQAVRASSAILGGGRLPAAPHKPARERAAGRWADLVDQVAVRLAVLIVDQVHGVKGD